MNRLKEVAMSDRLEGKRIIVTGCGYRPLRQDFSDSIEHVEPQNDYVRIDGERIKLNIGSAVAGVLTLNGADVVMVSRSAYKLRRIKESLDDVVRNHPQIRFSALDLLDEEQVRKFVEELPDDKPILLFPTPTVADRDNLGGRPSRIHIPTHSRQRRRLNPQFRQLQQAFRARRVELQRSTAGIVPEQVLVLETATGIENFIVAVRHIQGMEWLGEMDVLKKAQTQPCHHEAIMPEGSMD